MGDENIKIMYCTQVQLIFSLLFYDENVKKGISEWGGTEVRDERDKWNKGGLKNEDMRKIIPVEFQWTFSTDLCTEIKLHSVTAVANFAYTHYIHIKHSTLCKLKPVNISFNMTRYSEYLKLSCLINHSVLVPALCKSCHFYKQSLWIEHVNVYH
jgi:hypothetical protein